MRSRHVELSAACGAADAHPTVVCSCRRSMEMLTHSIATTLAEALERAVMGKRFSESGAILLCDHVRRLCDSLSALVKGSVRNVR